MTITTNQVCFQHPKTTLLSFRVLCIIFFFDLNKSLRILNQQTESKRQNDFDVAIDLALFNICILHYIDLSKIDALLSKSKHMLHLLNSTSVETIIAIIETGEKPGITTSSQSS